MSSNFEKHFNQQFNKLSREQRQEFAEKFLKKIGEGAFGDGYYNLKKTEADIDTKNVKFRKKSI